MALAQFRKWEKYIIWMVAILLVPIFAFTFGVGRIRNKNKSVPVLRLDGKTVYNTEITLLMHRMSLLHNMRFPRGKEGVERAAIFLLQIADARRAGIEVSPAEINTFRRKKFAKYVDPETHKFNWQEYRDFLHDFHITKEEMHKAMEEGLLLDKFSLLLDNTSLSSPYESYVLWAKENSEVICDLVSVKTADFIAAARKATVDLDAAVQAYLKKNAGNPDFIQPGKWRLEYILSRDAAWKPQQITEQDVKAYFKDPKNGYQNKNLRDVREEIIKALTRESLHLQAQRQIHEVEKNLSHFGAEEMPLSAERIIENDISLKRSAKEKQLESGFTGDTPLSLEEINKNPEIGGCAELLALLKKLDIPAALKPGTPPGKMLARLKQTFNTAADNFTSGEDFSNANGVFKIRIAEYIPGKVRDPKTDPAFRKELEDRLLKESAGVLALRNAEDLRQQVQDGNSKGLKFKAKTMKLIEAEKNYRELVNPMLAVGETTSVTPTPTGFEFAVLRGRTVPPYAAYKKLPAKTRAEFRKRATQASRRQWSYDYRIGRYTPVAGNRQRMWTVNALQNRIEHLYDWKNAGN